jgi:response regulator RpfG family c-di-GMP phosphodiesterase
MDKIENHNQTNLLYVSDTDDCETMVVLKQELVIEKSLPHGQVLEIEECPMLDKGIQIIKSNKHEIVIVEIKNDNLKKIENFIADVKSLGTGHCPAIFVVFSSDPGVKVIENLMLAGYNDFFVKPLSIAEIAIKTKIHVDNKYFLKNDEWRKEKLDKALMDIDKLENDLGAVKAELFDERDVLNNSLKQINLMTKERDKLKKEIEDADKELMGNLEGFTKLLCSMIESRIEENRGHSFRVAEICMFIAEEMKLSKIEKKQLEKAAMLHEAGKLLISDSILNKNENDLEDNEKDFFRHYPEKGARLLEMCSGLDKVADIVKYQNENVDGTGNPEGLKRKHIPLQSRILAGANLFDELRCKEEIASLNDLFEILEDNVGSRLDSKVVNCLEKYAVTRLGSDFEKVKGIGIHQLTTGMRLGTALFTSSGTKLFSANTLLDKESIEKIIKYNKEYPVDETIYIKA